MNSPARKLAVTGTRWLMESEVYPAALAARRLAHDLPDADERQTIQRITMDELTYGVFKPESIATFQQVIERLKGSGCDAVILGWSTP